jgi:hypothetical protein
MIRLYQLFFSIISIGAVMSKNLIPYFVITICLCFALSTVVFAEAEPNNTPGTATPLALNGSDGGSLSFTTDQIDWWVVTTTVDGALYVETNSDAGVDVDLHLYDMDGSNQIASYDISIGTKESTHRNNLRPGTYYVRANYAGGTGGGSYSISCTFTAASLQNDPEVNDSSSVAALLDPNSSATGHLGYYYNNYTDIYDWWKVTTTFDGSLVVSTISDNTFDLDLFLFDQDGKTQIASYDTSIGIREETHFNNLTPGTYYIKAVCLSLGSDKAQGAYTISNVFTPTGLTNDAEPNDSAQAALTLAVNDSAPGHLGYFNRGVYDVNDWWKVSLPNDGSLTVRTFSDATLDVDLFMYDVNGTTQIASYDTSLGRNEATHYNGLKAGTYYVRAYGGNYYNYGSYRISSHYAATNLAQDAEPNDALGSAQQIALNVSSTGHLGFFGNGARDQYDFYTFALTSPWDTLFVRSDSDPTLDIDLKLYDQSGSEIASSGASGSMELLVRSSTAVSTYSIRLQGFGYGSYAVLVTNVRPTSPLVDVKEQEIASGLPKNFSLSQNYPNPFNPATSISYTIPQGGIQHAVSVRIYDLLGREVAILVDEIKPAGTYTMTWDASRYASGVYFYRLQAGHFVDTKKLVLIK